MYTDMRASIFYGVAGLAILLLFSSLSLPVQSAVLGQRSGSAPGHGPAWMAATPLPTPALFADGTISTADDDMDAAFTADGRTLYFTKSHSGQRLGVIVVSHFENGRWSAPQVAPFSGRFTDYDPFITPDGQHLYFASNRPLSGSVKKDFDVWVVDKAASGWSDARNVGQPINTPRDEFYPAVAADGTLYFSATREEGLGGSDIYRAVWRDGGYAPPENLGPGVNSQATEVDSYVSPDQSFVVFAGFGRPDDMGSGDLYISERANGVWSPARHLGAGINSPAREYCPAASPDGKYFFFTSFRGFGDRVPDRPWTFVEWQSGLRSVLNGFGNVYQIDMAALR
jgi:WD40-like Beta Propeller Repeat